MNTIQDDIRVDVKTKVFIILPLVFFVIAVAAALYIPFNTELSGPEQEILNFRPENLEIRKQNEITVTALKSPFNFRAHTAAVTTEQGDDFAPQLDYNDNSLSLIVISGKKKMAVINGNLHREGDMIDGMRIARIEPGKVLLRNKGSQWLYLKNTH